jgi:hypothetical protein
MAKEGRRMQMLATIQAARSIQTRKLQSLLEARKKGGNLAALREADAKLHANRRYPVIFKPRRVSASD